jgi:hypothetical protein
LTDSEDVKIKTPCGVLLPIQPLSVLNDLKLISSPNQILNELTSSLPLFVNSTMVVSSNEKLSALTVSEPVLSETVSGFIEEFDVVVVVSACVLVGKNITAIENNKTRERKTPLVEDLIIFSNIFISQLNLRGYFITFVFVIRVFFISKLL